MAIFKAEFVCGQSERVKFDQVEGYRISVSFVPRRGFEGDFFVYLWDRIEADQAFEHIVEISEEDKPKCGELTVTDEADVTYVFPDIDLNYAELGATRAARYRLVEFKYDQHRIDRQNPAAIDLSNGIKKKLTKGKLGEDYDYKIDDGAEPLLGFRSRLAPNSPPVIRFSALRNESNSFLEKIVEINKSQIGNKMQSFTVEFGKTTFDVSDENLERVYVDESFGFFTSVPLPSLGEVEAGGDRVQLARLLAKDFMPEQLYQHDNTNIIELYDRSAPLIETATFVFQAGTYRDLKIT